MDSRLAAELSNVLTALEHARALFGGSTPPQAPAPFAPRPDLVERELGG